MVTPMDRNCSTDVLMILFRVAERIFNNGFSIGEQEDFGMISSAVALYRLSLAHGASAI